MKTFYIVFVTLILLLAYQTSNAEVKTLNPAPKEHLMEYINTTVMDDIGLVEGKGNSRSQAFEAAANDCFGKKLNQLKNPTEDQKLDIIDQCANIPY